MKIDVPQPVAIPPGSGKEFEFMGVTHKLTRPQTGGAFYLFEAEFEPGTGNGRHTHRYEDEVVYVLQGGIEIRLEDRKLQVEAGGAARDDGTLDDALFRTISQTYGIEWLEALWKSPR